MRLARRLTVIENQYCVSTRQWIGVIGDDAVAQHSIILRVRARLLSVQSGNGVEELSGC